MVKEHQREHHFFKTDDGALLRYAYWGPTTSSDIKPRIVLLQGRASCIEKVDHFIHRLNHDGYGVYTFDWRGQGLSTRELGVRGYIDTYDTFLKDLHDLLSLFVLPNENGRPLILLGHSMGAHIGLRYMAEYPQHFQAAVMTSPMLHLNTGFYPKAFAYGLSYAMVKLGLGKSYVFGHGDYNPATEPFEGNLLTHNQELFYQHRRLQIKHPELIVGGVTFQWVLASLESIRILHRPECLGQIKAPVHIMAAGEERVVDNHYLHHVVSNIPQCSLEVLRGARHHLLAETPDVQRRVTQSLDHMCQTYFPLPVGQESSVRQTPLGEVLPTPFLQPHPPLLKS
jgi:lysophospholipase